MSLSTPSSPINQDEREETHPSTLLGRPGESIFQIPTMTPQQFRDRVKIPSSQRERLTPLSQQNKAPILNRQEILDEQIDDPEFDDNGPTINALPESRIWGTELNVQTCINVFSSFVEFFETSNKPFSVNNIGKPLSLYRQQLESLYSHIVDDNANFIPTRSPPLINLNCQHLQSFPPTRVFYHQLVQFPQEIIPILDVVVQQEFLKVAQQRAGVENPDLPRLQVRPFNLEDCSRLRDLNPENIEQLIMIKGMVIRCSSIVPDLKQAYFRCGVCHTGIDVMIERGRIEEPNSCSRCQALGSMELIHNRCIFTDKQLIRLQETPDEVPEGETPYTVTLFAFDDLVDSVRPGDRVEVTGIFRAVPRRTNPRMRTVKSVFKTYVDVVHFRRMGVGESSSALRGNVINPTNSLPADDVVDFLADELPNNETATPTDRMDSDDPGFSAARVAEFEAFAKDGQAYQKLVQSFAPSIWGMEDVKKGLLCLLFGGTVRNSKLSAPGTTSSGVHQRGDINILLCGDPGTSKSQLLSYVHKLTARGIYTSGKGSSAVGLTASVIRDPETHDMVLESGALVLSDRGICCIDEFDKMSDTTRAILHEAMEQQTVSITKAGIIATLNARTSILASANPVQSRYNPRMSVVENLQLAPTLLSRFDLIYLILDKPSTESDRRLATHLVSLYYDMEDGPEEEMKESGKWSYAVRNLDTGAAESDSKKAIVDQRFLRDFIAYARYAVFPELTIEAETLLVDNYLAMRALGNRGMKTITATPRQLESLIRLSQALAKMRLSTQVLAEDVAEATRLMKVATQTAATDPRTGTIDMDLISTGRTALDRELVGKLAEVLRGIIITEAFSGKRLALGQVRQLLVNQGRNNLGESEDVDQDSGNSPMLQNVTMGEVEDALKELEVDGVVQYIERTQTVLIRSVS